jgi:hypothetical protein
VDTGDVVVGTAGGTAEETSEREGSVVRRRKDANKRKILDLGRFDCEKGLVVIAN